MKSFNSKKRIKFNSFIFIYPVRYILSLLEKSKVHFDVHVIKISERRKL